MTVTILVDDNWAWYIEQTGYVTNRCYKNGGWEYITLEFKEDALPDLLEKFFEAGIQFKREN